MLAPDDIRGCDTGMKLFFAAEFSKNTGETKLEADRVGVVTKR